LRGATSLGAAVQAGPSSVGLEDDFLRVEDLSVHFGAGPSAVPAVEGVSFSLSAGERLGIVGESGSGKTVTVSALMGLFPGGASVSGRVKYAGHELLSMSPKELRSLRGGDIALVPQEPTVAFSPVRRIGVQMSESLLAHRSMSRQKAMQCAEDALGAAKVPSPRRHLAAYPYELSGGMLQRVCIATALLCEPRLLIADEATTALDVSVQASILDLLDTVARERSMALILVSHDMSVIAHLCERAAVMYAGRIVELGMTAQLFSSPRHPYTSALLECRPATGPGARYTTLASVPGQQESGMAAHKGCAFAPRCHMSTGTCEAERPPLASIEDGTKHRSACWRSEEWRSFAKRDHGALAVPVAQSGASAMTDPGTTVPLLEAKGVTVYYAGRSPGSLRATRVKAVDQVSLAVPRARTLGLVGESGSGKSTVGRAVLGLQRTAAGTVRFAGTDLARADGATMRVLRRRMQLVLQSSFHSFDPRLSLGEALAEAVKLDPAARGRTSARVAELLELVELPRSVAGAMPMQVSGGQRQRASIARALATRPELVVADEPTSALDVSVRAGILNLLRRLQAEQAIAYVFISHDLAAVSSVSDEVAVMYFGRIVEHGPADKVFESPLHPYTRALLDAVPDVGAGERRRLASIPGEVPSLFEPPTGCPFHPRCPRATSNCKVDVPDLTANPRGHSVACFNPVQSEGQGAN
jgi:peptide/nickel transport system ATP-binding protein